MPLNFLDDSQQVKIPVGGGDFTPSGLIATWKATSMFLFYSETDIGMVDGIAVKPAMIRKTRNGFFYYYLDVKDAQQACQAMGIEIAPQQTWSWQAPLKSVLNFADEETRAKFNDPLSFNVRITSLQSKKHRHELHFIALPAIVHAAAIALGHKDVPPVSFNDLISANNPNRTDGQRIFTDQFQFSMIGNSDVDKNPDDPQHYAKSQLWLQRVALWNALGEPDATKYLPKGTGTKFDSTSDKLSEILKILTHPWKGSVWGRLINVPSPIVDDVAQDDEQKRRTVAAFVEIFKSEAEAKTVAEKELKERAERESAKSAPAQESKGEIPGFESATPTKGELPIGEKWKEMPDEWHKMIGELVTQYKGKPAPTIKKALAERVEELDATPEEIMAAMKVFK